MAEDIPACQEKRRYQGTESHELQAARVGLGVDRNGWCRGFLRIPEYPGLARSGPSGQNLFSIVQDSRTTTSRFGCCLVVGRADSHVCSARKRAETPEGIVSHLYTVRAIEYSAIVY
jgi:hypothetical protein